MSGIETVKIIVDAEKEAAQMLEQAKVRAAAIRKELSSHINVEREQMLAAAKNEADAIVKRAEEESKVETEKYREDATQKLKEMITRASARKVAAVDKLVSIVIEGKA